jgi:hypothetical protein
MSIHPQLRVQKAVRALLMNDLEFSTLSNGLFDVPVEGTPLPYVRFIEGSAQPDDVKDQPGWIVTLWFQAFDTGTNPARAHAIRFRIQELLHGERLDLEDGLTALVQHQIDLPPIYDPVAKTIGAMSRFVFAIS